MDTERKITLAPLLTPEEVSGILGVSTGTLAVWRCTGRYDLKYCKVGSKVMYKRESLENFIEQRTLSHTV